MTRVLTSICPFCFYEHNRTSAVARPGQYKDEPRMGAGDTTLCINCGEFSIMGKDDMLRAPTKREANEIARDYKTNVLRLAWLDTVGKSRGKAG